MMNNRTEQHGSTVAVIAGFLLAGCLAGPEEVEQSVGALVLDSSFSAYNQQFNQPGMENVRFIRQLAITESTPGYQIGDQLVALARTDPDGGYIVEQRIYRAGVLAGIEVTYAGIQFSFVPNPALPPSPPGTVMTPQGPFAIPMSPNEASLLCYSHNPSEIRDKASCDLVPYGTWMRDEDDGPYSDMSCHCRF